MILTEKTPSKDHYDYAKLIAESFKYVVVNILKRSAKDGILGEHHFYITFETHYEGVEIPDELRDAYPIEMTIILQYEFYELIAEEDCFFVTLHFNKKPNRLKIPYDAIVAFFDPSVDIRLFLKNPAIGKQNNEQDFTINAKKSDQKNDKPDEIGKKSDKTLHEIPHKISAAKPPAKHLEKVREKTEVISLDKFRTDK